MRRPVLGGLAALCVAATFAPWVDSGAATRSSYEVVRAAQDLGVLGGWLQPAAAAAWYFVPLVGALSVLALVLDRPVLGAVLLAVTGAAIALLAVKLMSGPLSTDWGTPAGAAGGSLALLAAAEVIIHERRHRVRARATQLG
ncbi:MAG: hypothetical protein JO291_03325 [Acidimicrobiia bacterium]|nr:hypothetical protein [Acidimicrobiia bacterium]